MARNKSVSKKKRKMWVWYWFDTLWHIINLKLYLDARSFTKENLATLVPSTPNPERVLGDLPIPAPIVTLLAGEVMPRLIPGFPDTLTECENGMCMEQRWCRWTKCAGESLNLKIPLYWIISSDIHISHNILCMLIMMVLMAKMQHGHVRNTKVTVLFLRPLYLLLLYLLNTTPMMILLQHHHKIDFKCVDMHTRDVSHQK
jgi:hypothetical protein